MQLFTLLNYVFLTLPMYEHILRLMFIFIHPVMLSDNLALYCLLPEVAYFCKYVPYYLLSEDVQFFLIAQDVKARMINI